MPYRHRASFRRGPRPTINTEKHVIPLLENLTTVNSVSDIAVAVTAPSNTVVTDCHRGGHIKAIWVSLDMCGLGASGVNVRGSVYLIKNPGNNLIPPGVFAVGSSNEKKFVVKM